MKKLGLILIITVLLLTVTACEKENKPVENNKGNNTTTDKTQIHEHCVRAGNISDDNSSVDLSYEIYYTGEKLNRIESTEKVTSTNESVLNEYEQAYRTIHSYYEDVDYYYTEVIRKSDSVTSKMVIDYDHVDAAKLMAMEGTENNVFDENGVATIAKYREMAKKFGVSCTQVS